MTKDDWSRLCRNIYEKKCILFIGPDFPLQLNKDGVLQPTSFSRILSEKLQALLSENRNVPASLKIFPCNKDFTQLAGDYIKYNTPDRKLSRDDLEEKVGDYLNDEIDQYLEAEEFDKLISAMPFTFIVNTNYSNFFYSQLEFNNKRPERDFYNFRGDYKDVVNSFSQENLGSESLPFIYNLFGCTDDRDSLVMSENELIEFVINLISKNPGLPKNIKSELANSDRYFLFLGFGIISRNWYFRILLQALESNNKGSMSYALEQIENIPDSEDPTIVFFRDDLKLSLYHYDQNTFIDELIKHYKEYKDKKEKNNSFSMVPYDAPKTFISYKREDYDKAYAIYMRLRKNGINAFLDIENLKREWKETLLDEIKITDSFLLLQSNNLLASKETEVFREINTAIDRSKRFASPSDFIFPAYIDIEKPILPKPEELSAINAYDLTKIENVDNLAKDIKRTYERNKRKNAA